MGAFLKLYLLQSQYGKIKNKYIKKYELVNNMLRYMKKIIYMHEVESYVY